MKIKSVTKILTAILLCAVLLTSCKKANIITGHDGTEIKIGDIGGLKLPLTDQNEEISMIAATSVNDINNKYIIKKLREITGINLKIDAYPSSTITEKLTTLIAAKSLPDIVGNGISEQLADDLCSQGAFAAVSDHLNIMPNFKSIFKDNKENDWIFKSYKAADGKLYGVYGYDWQRDVNHGVLYRKDIFDKHGLNMWNSPEEFYTALKSLKNVYPDSTPFTSKNQDGVFAKLSTSWGVAAHNPYYDEEEKVWKYSDTDPKYKDMLDYLRKLYDEKLIDPEFLTLTQSAWTSKMTQRDKAFVTWDWIGRLDMFKQQTAETVPEYDLQYGNPIGPKQTIQTLSKISWPKYVTDNKKSETAFKLLDFLLSPWGAELITMGIENETYVLDDNGMAKYIEFPEDKKIEITDLEEKYGMFLEGMYMRFDRRSCYFNFSEREKKAQEYAKDKNKMEPIDPILTFTQEEKKRLTELEGILSKAGKEFATKYILSDETGDNAWDSWLQEAKRLGADEVVQIHNDAQKRYDEM